MIKVVDLSKWNVIDDYHAVKSDGINHAILKAINSANHPDSRFKTHLSGCKDAGIQVIGTYHYTYAKNVVQAEANAKAWLETIYDRDMYYFLDWEDNSLPKDSRLIKEIIEKYDEVISNAGCKFAIYTGQYLYNSLLSKCNLNNYLIWIARYYRGYKEFAPSTDPAMNYCPNIPNAIGWQYTSSCKVNGIQGKVDMSVWLGNIEVKNVTIAPNQNPFTEPTHNVKLGTLGNDANWVLWYLWRFGLLVDESGEPNAMYIDGVIGVDDIERIKEAQRRLGLAADGIVGRQTRAMFRKIC